MTGMKYVALLIVGSSVALGAGCALRMPGQAGQTEGSTRAAPTWGPVAQGLQCRLRPVKRIWPAGEPPAFKVDLRNQGTRIFAFPRSQDIPLHRFCVDGRWYRWPTSAATETRVWPLAPKVEFPDLPVTLPQTVCGPLRSGRHTIQVAFVLEGIEVISDPVGIEVTTPAGPPARPAR
jgi:hypothetical protein